MPNSIYIAKTYLISAAGANAKQIYQNLKTNKYAAQLSGKFCNSKTANNHFSPAYIAEINKYADLQPPTRITAMLIDLFSLIYEDKCFAVNMPADSINKDDNNRRLLLIILPPNNTKRAYLTIPAIKNFFKITLNSHKNLDLCYCDYNDSTKMPLWQLNLALTNDCYQAIYLIGVDSLVNHQTAQEYSQIGDLATFANPTGAMLGEAAACLKLTTKPTDTIIVASSQCDEPHPDQGDRHQLTGLSQATTTLLQQHNLTPKQIDTVLFPTGNRTNDAFEQQQLLQAIWPHKNGYQPKTLSFNSAIGELGAATLPFYLAMAQTYLTQHSHKQLIVTDIGDYPIRTAILLRDNNYAK